MRAYREMYDGFDPFIAKPNRILAMLKKRIEGARVLDVEAKRDRLSRARLFRRLERTGRVS